MFTFREDITLKLIGSDCEFHGPVSAKLKDLNESQINLVITIKKGIPLDQVPSLPAAHRGLLQSLYKKGLVIQKTPTEDRNSLWLDHFVGDAQKCLKTLSEKQVLIIGCGGTGSIVADHLARAGIKKMILIDPARLDEPDLNRQLPFTKKQLGQYKVDALASFLNKNFKTQCETYSSLIDENFDLNALPKVDLIINCADKPKYIIEKLCLKLSALSSTPVLFGSVGIQDFSVGPLLVNEDSKNRYLQKLTDLQNEFPESQIMKASICFINTLASAQIGLEAFNYLSGIQSHSSCVDRVKIFNPFKGTENFFEV